MEDNTKIDIDPELVAGFVDEAEEGLATLDSLFVKLEAEPTNLDIITSIFRPIHTIKGNSAFFGLMKVKKLSHEMETLLDLAKKEKFVPNQSIINVLLAGVDKLKEMLQRTREQESEIQDENSFNELIQRVISAREIKEDKKELWTELLQKLDKVKTDLCRLDSSYTEQIDAVIAIASCLKADKTVVNGQAGKDQIQSKATVPKPLQEIKSILDRKGEEGLDTNDAAVVLEDLTVLKKLTTNQQAVEIIDSALDEYHRVIGGGDNDHLLLTKLLREKIEVLLSLDGWKIESDSDKAKPVKQKEEVTNPKEQHKTMRVTEVSIDNFLSHVGELIAIGEMYNHLQKTISEKSSETELANEFRRINETFNNLSDNLQKSIMEVRKVSINTLLQKIPRMVRDTASACNKEIKVELSGEDIEVDKRLLETLDGPLTHMVRNAVDHGIETPEDRLASGKPRQGVVRVAVTETADKVMLLISDDGKGLDIEAIRTKAVSLGLLDANQEISQEQIIDTIFSSGVSTAKKVTEVSGRGVGMDVVKRNIAAANGNIYIDTKPCRGTEFRIQLPKTVSTLIINGFLVKIADNRYVIPMEKLQEVFRPESHEISSIVGKGEYVNRHNNLLPVIRLAEVFGNSSSDRQSKTGDIMVSINANRKKIVICVDDVIGVQKVVLKELDSFKTTSQLFSAAALMGDGTVAMVLDVDHLSNTE